MNKWTKVGTKVVVSSVILSGSIYFGGVNATATDIGNDEQISVVQEVEKCYEFEDGVLTLKGIVDKEQIEKFANKKAVEKIVASEGTVLPSDCSFLFYCLDVKSIDFAYADSSNVTCMSHMFDGCGSLTALDLSGFDTGNVTDMSYMFNECDSLTSLDLRNFNTKNVTDMSGMFRVCRSLASLDVSSFDTANVTNMSAMFSDCSSLQSLDLSNFDTKNVTDMSGMFGCVGRGCSSLKSLDIRRFDTSNVTNMKEMFYGCRALASLDTSSFNTGKVTDMGHMFGGCDSVTSLDLRNFITDNVQNMGHMFWGCKSLTSLDIRSFNTSNVTNMEGMFCNCSALTGLDVSSFDTKNVTNMEFMFRCCSALKSLDLRNFDTGNVSTMRELFSGCSSLASLDISIFNTSNVTEMYGMFMDCSSLTSLDLSNFVTGNVTNMMFMFQNCSALTSLELSSFDTENANIGQMFSGASSLYSIKLGDGFKRVDAGCHLVNGEKGWAGVFARGERLSGSDEYAVIENNGCWIYYKIGSPYIIDVKKQFTDIPDGEWYVDAIQFVFDEKIMNGVDEGIFAPKGTLTREQFITVLYNMEGTPETTAKKSFDDMKDDPEVWYAKPITWAVENKITSGIGDNLFGIGKEITREQLATLLYNYAGQRDEFNLAVKEDAIADFPDSDQVSEWATTGMKWAVTNGVMGGKSGKDGKNILDPKGKATRAECAQMIKNLKEKAIE